MKKVFLIIFLICFLTSIIKAGDAGNIMASDILLGTFVCSGFGTLLALPSYMQGGSQNATVLAVGASYGALIGAGLGFIYGIYDLIQKKQTQKELPKKTMFFRQKNDIVLNMEFLKLSIIKIF